MILRLALVLCTAASASGQPLDAERKALLEERRALLLARLAEFDAEIRGDVPPGTVQVVGGGRMPGGVAGDRPPPRAGDLPRGPREPIDEATRERMLAELAESDPELADRIRAMTRSRRGAASPVFGRLRELAELRDRDPEAFTLRRTEIKMGLDVLRLSAELRDLFSSGADEAAIEAASDRLRGAVAAGFDAKSAVLESEIDRTEQKLVGMRTKLDSARANRSEIIESHFSKLLQRIERATDRRTMEPVKPGD